jgi:hypothetical protein
MTYDFYVFKLGDAMMKSGQLFDVFCRRFLSSADYGEMDFSLFFVGKK